MPYIPLASLPFKLPTAAISIVGKLISKTLPQQGGKEDWSLTICPLTTVCTLCHELICKHACTNIIYTPKAMIMINNYNKLKFKNQHRSRNGDLPSCMKDKRSAIYAVNLYVWRRSFSQLSGRFYNQELLQEASQSDFTVSLCSNAFSSSFIWSLSSPQSQYLSTN